MKRIIISGGTGFIGLSLAEHLSHKGFHPILIARNKPDSNFGFEFIQWDGVHRGDWIHALDGAIAIVNLAGKSVDCVKSPDNCDLILRSRVSSTRAVGDALRLIKNPPRVWVQMSTAHIYGDPPVQICTEGADTGHGLAPFVGNAWEEAFHESLPGGVRDVILRTGFVIGKGGGAFKQLSHITKLGFGGKIGHGRQGMSWIHQYDLNEIIYQAIVNPNFQGIYNACVPYPVSNAEFMRVLRKVLRVPIGIPSPAWLTIIGAWILRTDPELALYGRYVVSTRLNEAGFAFRFPHLGGALEDLV